MKTPLHIHRTSRRRSRGFSMIEVLVAFVIFSFGMLGLAGLQTRLLTYNQSSLLRTQAAALTDDILDRMRLDRQNAINSRWDTDLDQASADITNGTQAFQYDLREWKAEVEAALPEGRASIVMNVAQNNTVTIVVEWNDSRGTDTRNTDGGRERFETRSRL